jgi:membrane-associated phospholipid phosphatase
MMTMEMFDRVLELFITVVLIVGGYQFYFWAQRQTFFDARYFETRWDQRINFDPRWVWIYSGLYYPMILLAALTVPTWQAYAYTVGCFLTLLAVQVASFIFWPVAIPPHWREHMVVKQALDNDMAGGLLATERVVIHRERASVLWPHSMQMLDLVWSYDKLRNSLPSMHVSVAMMVDLTIWQNWPVAGYVGGLFPLLIAVSALKTKQHYVVDVVPGAILGAAVFFGWHHFVA